MPCNYIDPNKHQTRICPDHGDLDQDIAETVEETSQRLQLAEQELAMWRGEYGPRFAHAMAEVRLKYALQACGVPAPVAHRVVRLFEKLQEGSNNEY